MASTYRGYGTRLIKFSAVIQDGDKTYEICSEDSADIFDMQIDSHYGGPPEITFRVSGYGFQYKLKEETETFVEDTGMNYRNVRFPIDGGVPIAASVPGYDKIPFNDTKVTLIGVGGGGGVNGKTYEAQVTYAKSIQEKRELAFSDADYLLIAWPGKYSQDIFIVDDFDALRRALGFVLKSEATWRDEQGKKWLLNCD